MVGAAGATRVILVAGVTKLGRITVVEVVVVVDPGNDGPDPAGPDGPDGPDGAPPGPDGLPPAGEVDPGTYWIDGRLASETTLESKLAEVVVKVEEVVEPEAPAAPAAPDPEAPLETPVRVAPAGRLTVADALVPSPARTTVLDPEFPLASV